MTVPFLLASLACPPPSDVKRWGQKPSTEQPLGSHKLPLKVHVRKSSSATVLRIYARPADVYEMQGEGVISHQLLPTLSVRYALGTMHSAH